MDGQPAADGEGLSRARKEGPSGSRLKRKLPGTGRGSAVVLLLYFVVFFLSPSSSSSGRSRAPWRVAAWEWSDLSAWTLGGGGFGRGGGGFGGGGFFGGGGSAAPSASSSASADSSAGAGRTFFTFEEVSAMRVRDLKWHLARRHGYGADEIGRMIDKKDLIEALAIEEEKARIGGERRARRRRVRSSVLWSLGAVAAVIGWPLIRQAADVVYVNAAVYYDRKRYEASVCREHKSPVATVGFLCMFVIDALQAWLSVSITLSWFVRRRWWFFPTPHLPVRPGQFMGEDVAKSQAGSYGINVGPMVLAWLMRYVHSKIESWTGRALVRAQREQRRRQREAGTAQERAARRGAKRAAKEREAEEAGRHASRPARSVAAAARTTDDAHAAFSRPAAATDWMEPERETLNQQAAKGDAAPTRIPTSAAHEDFLSQLEEIASPLDDLD